MSGAWDRHRPMRDRHQHGRHEAEAAWLAALARLWQAACMRGADARWGTAPIPAHIPPVAATRPPLTTHDAVAEAMCWPCCPQSNHPPLRTAAAPASTECAGACARPRGAGDRAERSTTHTSRGDHVPEQPVRGRRQQGGTNALGHCAQRLGGARLLARPATTLWSATTQRTHDMAAARSRVGYAGLASVAAGPCGNAPNRLPAARQRPRARPPPRQRTLRTAGTPASRRRPLAGRRPRRPRRWRGGAAPAPPARQRRCAGARSARASPGRRAPRRMHTHMSGTAPLSLRDALLGTPELCRGP